MNNKNRLFLVVMAVAALTVVAAPILSHQVQAQAKQTWWVPKGGHAEYTGPSENAPDLKCSSGFGYTKHEDHEVEIDCR